jgi:hypothetical protein
MTTEATAVERVALSGGGVSDVARCAVMRGELQTALRDMPVLRENLAATAATRFCVWGGQSEDGLKHGDPDADDPEVRPFDGSFDTRVRLADMLVHEDVMLLVVALMRAKVGVIGQGPELARRAALMQKVLDWVVRNKIGARWMTEWVRLANYYVGDTPAVALMAVEWERVESRVLEAVTAAQVIEAYAMSVAAAQGAQGADEATAAAMAAEASGTLAQLIADSAETGAEAYDAVVTVVADQLAQAWPEATRKRLEKMARQVCRGETVQVPRKVVRKNGPVVRACRLYQDWIVPANAGEWDDLPLWFRPMLLTRGQVEALGAAEKWDPEFTKKVLEQDGKVAHPMWYVDATGTAVTYPQDRYRGLYQVWTGYFQALTEDDCLAKFKMVFHPDVEVPAGPAQLVPYQHGKWPGQVFVREALSDMMLDARGVVELAGPMQGTLKTLFDVAGDNAIVTGVPPILSRGRQKQGRLKIGALEEIELKRDGDVKFMQSPSLPPGLPATVTNVLRMVNDYHGRNYEGVDPQLVNLHREYKVLFFLNQAREVLVQLLQLVQQKAMEEPELLDAITDGEGRQLVSKPEEIQGQFGIEVDFDPRVMDMEYVRTVGKTVTEMLQLDRGNAVDTFPIVETLMGWLLPDVARRAIRAPATAAKAELEDELAQYLRIRGGVEPPLPAEGANYAARVQMYVEMEQANPAVYDSMPADQSAILKSRVERMKVQAEQYGVNPQIGREGGKRALDGDAEKPET